MLISCICGWSRSQKDISVFSGVIYTWCSVFISYKLIWLTSFFDLVFTSQPSDSVVSPSTQLQLPCTASTNLSGVLHILWKRNNSWIVDYKDKHYRQLSNGSLLFEKFLYADQGLYRCSALVIDASHNHLGQVYSRNATIKIACKSLMRFPFDQIFTIFHKYIFCILQSIIFSHLYSRGAILEK